VATAIGLLYLTWSYGKLKWKYVILGAGLLALGVGLVWGNTSDSGPWYLKRLDFSRPSAQHRVSAWRGAVQMMWDHPLGVGWNQAVSVYDKNYSPPEGGAVALTMNSYLMLGTELGLPGLLCFVAYVALQLGVGRWQMADRIGKAEGGKRKAETLQQIGNRKSEIGNQVACRAGAIVLLVAFWFDGGLFDLPTAAVFWVLLELGVEKAEIHLTKVKSEKPKPAEYLAAKEHKEHIDTDSSPHPSPRLARRGRNFLRSLRSFVAIKSGIGNRQLVRASLPRRLPRQVVLH
jgi:O-antigen ligase